jgi:hypothetical protein
MFHLLYIKKEKLKTSLYTIYSNESGFDFCEKNELSDRTLRTFKNRGPVNLQMRKNYNKRIEKTIGWS